MALLSVNSAPVDFDIVNTVNETHSLLDQLKHDYPEISLQFKEWKSQRIKSIDAVHDLLKKLEKVEYSCRVAQGSGAALALAGQVTGLVLCVSRESTQRRKTGQGIYESEKFGNHCLKTCLRPNDYLSSVEVWWSSNSLPVTPQCPGIHCKTICLEYSDRLHQFFAIKNARRDRRRI
ncbi:uncharacterized protein TNCV_4674821 [Trichonephila clavipes]|nr:uncharacterized protein TNCV_4674821 [Trichonephila clavipes]